MYKYLSNKFRPIGDVPEKRGLLDRIEAVFLKIGNIVELLFILFVWVFIFTNYSSFGNYSLNEIITYLIAGNFISIITGYLLHRSIVHNLLQAGPDELAYNPMKFLRKILSGFSRNFFPFLVAIGLNLLVAYIFIKDLLINFDAAALTVICFMVIFAFITELLIAYLVRHYIISTFETGQPYKIFERIKKLLAGNFFPLSFLPLVFVKISLTLPFAYTFYVPTEIYLKKMTVKDGLYGLAVQIVWIILLYLIARTVWKRKTRSEAKTA